MRDATFLDTASRARPGDGDATIHSANAGFGVWRLHVSIEAGSTAVVRWRLITPNVSAVREVETAGRQRKWMVESSGSPGGPFVLLSDRVDAAARQFVDASIRLDKLDEYRRYYRVTLLELTDEGDESTWEKVFSVGYHPEWWAATADDGGPFGVGWGYGDKLREEAPPLVLTARNRITMMLQRRSAEACYLYRPEREGEYSHEHVDLLSGMVVGDDFVTAQSTHGSPTSSPRGYYAPMATFISASPSQGKDLGVQVQGVMPHWPPPQIGDRLRMITDASIMEVVAAIPNHMYGYATHWSVILMHLDTNDLLTNIPMPEDHPFTSGHARRQMARAMNLDSFYQSQQHGRIGRASPDLPPWQGGPGPSGASGRGWDE